jgi:hypothetical protein
MIMKIRSYLIVMTLLAGAVSAFSQGTVSLYDYGTTFSIQIFAYTDPYNPTFEVSYGGEAATENMGNTANPNEIPAGTTTYVGPALGAGFDVQLLAAPGLNDLLSRLVPSSAPISTWYSGSASTGLGGFWNSTELGTVNGSTTTATVALAAWQIDGGGGAATTLAEAQAIGYDWGISATGNIYQLGGINGAPPNLPVSIESFSLGINYYDVLPEPSTLAFLLLAGAAFGARRWRTATIRHERKRL